MSRPDPIQYAERLYSAIRAANFSPMSFLAFGNAVKEGISMRNMPRIAAEPFMRIVGEMLELEEAEEDIIDAEAIDRASASLPPATQVVEVASPDAPESAIADPTPASLDSSPQGSAASPPRAGRRRSG